jgi:hypothetical protein
VIGLVLLGYMELVVVRGVVVVRPCLCHCWCLMGVAVCAWCLYSSYSVRLKSDEKRQNFEVGLLA